MSQFTNYGNMYNIPQDTLVLSKDQGLAKVSIAHVLRQADRFSEYQSILLFQKELLGWYKELSVTLDDWFYANAKYIEYKEHISNLVLNSNAMSNMPIFGAQTNSFLFGLQSLSRSQLSEDQAVSQLKSAVMTIVSIVGKMKTAVGIHEQKAVPQPAENAVKGNKHNATSLNNNKIFIVHGHNDGMKQGVARFIEKNKIEAIILDEQANNGNVLIEKFEKNSDVGYAVVLCSGDDMGYPKNEPDKPKPRARQNVVFELGYFFAKLGRGRVAVLFEEGVDIETPSDISGIAYIGYDRRGAWKTELARELEGCAYVIHKESLV